MTQYVFIILTFTLVVTICASAQLQCGVGEIEESCPSKCEVHYCPKRENYQRQCPKPDKCPPPACQCRFNYKLASNGTCIPTRECPPFECKDPNAEFNPCPPYCPSDDCSQASPDGRCLLFGRILVLVECQPACRCKKGYWKLNGSCVPYEQCPNKEKNKSLAEYLQYLQL